MDEQKKYEVIKRLVDENGNKDRAALTLGITKRQVYRLIKVYREKGKAGFVHGNRGRKPVSTIPDATRDLVLDLYKTKYYEANFTHFTELLERIEGIKLSVIQKDVESNYAYFPVVFDGYKYTRNEVFEKLAEQGIGARKYFFPLTNSFECYRNYPTAGAEKTPVAQHMALRVLTLPLYADLSLEDVDRICDAILG